MSYWSQSSFQSTHIHISKTISVTGSAAGVLWWQISCGGSHRSLCYRVLLPGCRGRPALVLLPNWGVSTLCSLQPFSTAVSELESTLFKFYQILIFLLYFVLTVGVLDKRWCLGYLLSFEILLKHFTLKFFRMRWVPIEGKSFPEICNLCQTICFQKVCVLLTWHTWK